MFVERKYFKLLTNLEDLFPQKGRTKDQKVLGLKPNILGFGYRFSSNFLWETLCDWTYVEVSQIPSIKEGEILLQTMWLSLDPYMRGRMNDAKSYADPVQIGAPMVGGAVAKVIESRSPMFSKNDIVEGRIGWQKYAVSSGI